MSKAVAKVEQAQAPATTDGAVVLSLLDKVISNPDVPLERVEQAFNLHLRIQAEQHRKEYAAAMADAQSRMKAVRTDALNRQTNSRYATFGALDAVVRPIYSECGFALSYNTESPAPDVLRVIAYVSHRSGYEREFRIDMPADGKGAKGGDVMTKTHAAGSALSYGKRYLLGAIFNIAVERDDDGNKAAGGVITPEQAEELAKLISETKTDIHKFLEIGGLESLSDMPANKFASARAMLLKKREAMA